MEATSRGAFSIAVVVVAVVVGVVSFAAFMVLIAFADDLRQPQDGGEHALSKSAVGFAGLVSLLEGSGRQVRISRGPWEELNRSNEFIIVTPPPEHELSREEFFNIWGRNLIILPKWDTRRTEENPGWVHNAGLLDARRIERILDGLAGDVIVARTPGSGPAVLRNAETAARIPLGAVDTLQTIVGEYLTAILTDTDGHIVLASVRETEDEDSPIAYVLADPDLLNTHGIATLETAQAGLTAIDMVAPNSAPFAFDMTLHGMERTRNILQLLFTPPFLAGVLCLTFAGALITITAFAGNLRSHSAREIPLGKTTLVDNSAQLISLAGRSAGIGERYVAMVRRQAAHAVGLPPGSSDKQQTAMLDTVWRGKASSNEPLFSELSSDVMKASNSIAMLRAINRLYKWKQELGRERRRR